MTTPQLPPQHAQLYEYVFARNGIFVRAERPELAACIPVSPDAMYVRRSRCHRVITTFSPLWNVATAEGHHAPLVAHMVVMAQAARDDGRRSSKKYSLGCTLAGLGLGADRAGARRGRRRSCARPTLTTPPLATRLSRCIAIIGFAARFSLTDDRDERGFKLYGVLGDLDTLPTLRLRVGIYGHHHEIPDLVRPQPSPFCA